MHLHPRSFAVLCLLIVLIVPSPALAVPHGTSRFLSSNLASGDIHTPAVTPLAPHSPGDSGRRAGAPALSGMVNHGSHADLPDDARPVANAQVQHAVRARFDALPIRFDLNQGQLATPVRFLARGAGYDLFLTTSDAVLTLDGPCLSCAPTTRQIPSTRGPRPHTLVSGPPAFPRDRSARPMRQSSVRLSLVGANPHPQIIGLDRLPGVSNYFLGNNPQHWRAQVPGFARVEYRAIYPGIDVIYYGRQGHLEDDYILAPGANPAHLRLRLGGARALTVDARGALLIQTAAGTLRQGVPQAYQDVAGQRRGVAAWYVTTGHGVVAIHIGPYDRSRPLIVDPTLIYSTYLGGRESEIGHAIAVDGSGNAYVTGETGSTDFPTKNAFQPSRARGVVHAFVTKLDAGGALAYSTYLGGSGGDYGHGVAVDGSGNAYVTGSTGSTDFPTKNAFQPSRARGVVHAFVTKLDAGGALAYSTFLAGGGDDSGIGYGIAVDGSGNAYVTGTTASTHFPTKNAFQPSHTGPGYDAYVTKLDTGGALAYSTYLSGSGGGDTGYGIAVDGSGNAYVTGVTYSEDFPTKNAFQPSPPLGGTDAFVAKISANVAPPAVTSTPPTPTDTPTPTVTSMLLSTPPSGSTTTPARCDRGVTVDIADWHLSIESCSATQRTATVRVVAPAGLRLSRLVFSLHNVPLQAGRIARPVRLPNLSLSLAGFRLAARDLYLAADDSLVVGVAQISLPQRLSPGACGPLTIYGLHIGRRLHPFGGAIPLGQPLQVTLFGATILADGLSLTDGAHPGLSAAHVSVTLPDVLGGTAGLTADSVVMRDDGTVEGHISAFNFTFGDLQARATGARVTADGLQIQNAAVTFPFGGSTLSLNDLSYDGDHISLSAADANLTLPDMTLGGFQISGTASLQVQTSGNALTYDFKGKGHVTLPHFGPSIAASIEVGSIDDAHPSNLYGASLAVDFVTPIPIGEPPLLQLRGIYGHVEPGADGHGHVIYTFGLGGHLSTIDGVLLDGTVGATVATDYNVGMSGDATLLRLLHGSIGLCARFTTANDSVCADSLPRDVLAPGHAPTGEGVFAGMSASLDLPVSNGHTAGAYARAFGQIVPGPNGQAPQISAVTALATHMERGYLVDLFQQIDFPPCKIYGSITGQLGIFHYDSGGINPDRYERPGMKGTFKTYLCGQHAPFTAQLFIGYDESNNFGIKAIGLDRYTFTGPSLSSSVTRVPAAHAPQASEALGVAPLPGTSLATAAPPSSAVMTVVPIRKGETSVLFGLNWRRGAPRLTLIAPNGAVITPARPGPGGYTFNTTDPRFLPRGVKRAVTLYFPMPQAGLWHIRISNLTGGEGYRFAVVGTKPLPVLTIAAPRRGQTLVARPSAPSVSLAGSVVGTSSGGTVSLFYAPTRAIALRTGTVPDAAGTPIAYGVPIVRGAWVYRWMTSSVPAGHYYVYATLDNGTGPLVTGYSAGAVDVMQPTRPAPPRVVVGQRRMQHLTIAWVPPAQAALIAGYRIRWRTSDMPKGTHRLFDAGDVQSVDLSVARIGVSYAATVSAYDMSGRESVAIPVRFANGSAQGGKGKPGPAPRSPDYRIFVSAARLQAGGTAAIPVTLKPIGKSTGTTNDFVTLDVAGLPAGVGAQFAPRTANLFAPRAGVRTATLYLSARAATRYGSYRITIKGSQLDSNRVRLVTLRLTIGRPGRSTDVFGRHIAIMSGTHGGQSPASLGAAVPGSWMPTSTHASWSAAGFGATVHLAYHPLAHMPSRAPPPLSGIATWAGRNPSLDVLAGPSSAPSPPTSCTIANQAALNAYNNTQWRLPGTGVTVTPRTFRAILENDPRFHYPVPAHVTSPLAKEIFNHPDFESAENAYFGPLVFSAQDRSGVSISSDTRFQNYYYDRDNRRVGRATGIVALIKESSLRLNAYEAPTMLTPGWEPDKGLAVGHLLANVFGAPSNDARNYATLWHQPTNNSLMLRRELRIKFALTKHRVSEIFYRVLPHYIGRNAFPSFIEVEAISPEGYHVHAFIPNDGDRNGNPTFLVDNEKVAT